MSTDDILLKKETDILIGWAIDVHNELGHGFHEKPYENALVAEFRIRSIPYKQQARFDIASKDTIVGEFIPDLIIYDRIVVDTKVIENIGRTEMGQMMNYLKVTKLRVGYILNFKHPRLQWKRVVR